MRGWRQAIALLLLLPLLGGCWSRRELNDLALVVSLGIDLAEDGLYEVTLGVAGPGAVGGGKGQPGGQDQQKRIVVTGRGRSFAGILREIELRLPRRVNLTHTLVVLVGERLAERGLDTALDFILRAPEFRLQGMIMLVQGGAIRTYMETSPLMESLPSKALTEIAQARIGLAMRLWEFFSARATTYRAAMLPVVEMVPHPTKEPGAPPYEARLGGAAVLSGDRVVLHLNEQEVRAIKWLRGHGREGVVTVPCGEEPGEPAISFRITQAAQTTRVSVRGNRPAYTVALRGKLRVSEMQCARSIWQKPVQDELLGRAEKELQDLVERVIRKLQAAEVDPLYFGEQIRALHPAVWRQVGGADWGKTWRETPVAVTVDLRLETTGLMGDPHTAGRTPGS